MGTIERQIRKAQRRLWLNRWLHLWGWAVLLCASAWTLSWLADRLFLPGILPRAISAGSALVLSLAVSLIALLVRRDSQLTAAIALDQAAGVHERISSSLCFQRHAEDPFAQAVIADAEQIAAGLTPAKFIPVRWSRSLSLGGLVIVVAVVSLLLPEFDLLGRKDAEAAERGRLDQLNRVQSVVAKPVSVMREIADQHPDADLGDIARKIGELEAPRKDADPDVLRREAKKTLDRLQDSLKQKANSERMKAFQETKKRLKQLGDSKDTKTELGQLLTALSAGDFEEAQQAVKKAQERLAKRAQDGKLDPQQAKQMRDQLNDIAKKLQKAAKDEQSSRELQNAGLSQAEAKRVLEALSKKDPKQIEKLAKDLAERLKDKGVTEEQLQELMEKIQQRQKACKNCQGLKNSLAGAAKQLEAGNTTGAADELGEAAETLDEMEQMEEALNDLDAQMAELDNARDELDDASQSPRKCASCKGTGYRPDGAPCPQCGGTGH